ncbi:MAG: outer membrane lipoprotein carrier protein LolA [Bacteroidota bacterium]
MNSNKTCLGIFIFSFIVCSGFISGEVPLFSQDKRAEEIINQSRDFYYTVKDMSMDFTYEVKGITARQALQKGTLKLKRTQYQLRMREQETYCDGRKVWVFIPATNEYMVFAQGEWTYGNIMQLFYSMYYSPSEKSYMGEEIDLNGSRLHKIRFRMLDPDHNYSTAYAWYFDQNKLLSKVTYVDRQRRQRTFSFYNLKLNSGLGDNDFIFRPQNYPGIELRR